MRKTVKPKLAFFALLRQRIIRMNVRQLAKLVTIQLATGVLGFLFGAGALYVLWVRGGPPLELWHTEELEEEFTARDSREIKSFNDYRLLEDRLYAEMDNRIYQRTENGPAFEFARFSSGSAADPRWRNPNWNRTFELDVEDPVGGVLLLHGMSDSPYSLRALSQSLHAKGYHVVGLRLPGHGTVPSGLLHTKWEDSAAAVDLAMDHLFSKLTSKPVHIVGYSTGAGLAIHYSLNALEQTAHPRPASLVLLSPAIGITPAAAFAKWKRRLSAIPGLDKLAWQSILPEFDPYKYNSFTTNAGEQVYRLTSSTAARVEVLSDTKPIEGFPPTLMFLSTVDATVSADAVVDNLLEHLAPDGHELVLFDINRNHINESILVSDPGPLTQRLLENDHLPFSLTLVTNADEFSENVAALRKPPFSNEVDVSELENAWPRGVISLSHISLSFPSDDTLYGIRRSQSEGGLNLGQIEIQGEKGLLRFPSDWLLRLRHNPFYGFLEERALDWIENGGTETDPSQGAEM